MAGLTVGDPLPWFVCPTHQSEAFRVETLAGRRVLLLAFGSSAQPPVGQALRAIMAEQANLAAGNLAVAGLATDPTDALARTFSETMVAPVFLDRDLAVSRSLSLVQGAADGKLSFLPLAFLLDRRLRVTAILPFRTDTGAFMAHLRATLAEIDTPDAKVEPVAPVLVIPRVFEPEFCRQLMALYDAHGGEVSGFMRSDSEGRTVHAFDPKHKKRRDYLVEAEPVRAAIRERLSRRVVPEIKKAYQFEASRIERYLVACYLADEGGFFRQHRDNTTKGTAHRRFACSINLATDLHEGGDLRFPEFGDRTYRPPSGGAVLFSCSLLHEATPVTQGRRYCVLPFLYDEEAAKIRQANLDFIVAKESA